MNENNSKGGPDEQRDTLARTLVIRSPLSFWSMMIPNAHEMGHGRCR